jgi:hypothetical protein
VVAALRTGPAFAPALADVVDGDAVERRATVRRERRHDDDWFCRRFGITALL